MMPTLLQGDFIFVSKFSYGLRLPVLETKILETGLPERGDVAVFRLPSEPNVNYIKRIIGLPGDEITYDGHRLTINGDLMPLTRDEAASTFEGMARFIEDLGDRDHAILITKPGFAIRDGTYAVPEGHYFMMGDNRDNSRDSRFIGDYSGDASGRAGGAYLDAYGWVRGAGLGSNRDKDRIMWRESLFLKPISRYFSSD